MEKSKASSPYIYGIDVVRFLCALMVTMFHLGFASWASPAYLRPYKMPLIENVTQPGWVGVQLFFVISGLVIVNSAFSANALWFLRGRILRLYPAVWICASLTFIFIARHGFDGYLIKTYVRSIILYPVGPWIDGQYWTLATEICFYALVFMMSAVGQRTKMSALAFGLTAASAIFNAALWAYPDSSILIAFTGAPYQAIPLFLGCHFAIGIYIWLWSRRQMSTFSWVSFACALVTGLAQVQYAGEEVSSRTVASAGHAFSTVPAIGIWAVGIILIFAAVGYSKTIGKLPSSILQPFRALGLMTFPLYLLHFEIGVQFLDWATKKGIAPLLALTLIVPALCLLSLGVCKFGEPPIRNALRFVLDSLLQKGGSLATFRLGSTKTPTS
jgi:exopolysaccharide production protein ExoZ